MKDIVTVSLIIPTMNRPNALERTLKKVIEGSKWPAQIIIVDQTNQKDMIIGIEKLKQIVPEIIECIYIRQDVPSLTKARNTGFERVSQHIIVCSDDDVDVEKDTFSNIETIMLNPEVAMIAGLDTHESHSDSKWGYIFYNKSYLKRNKGHVVYSIHGRYPSYAISGQLETEWAMGFFFVVRAELLKKWNIKWDEQLVGYAYAEDLDFSYTYYKCANKCGLKCVLDERVKVKHLATKEYRIPTYKHTLMYVINREYLSYKHYKSPISRLCTRWANMGQFLKRTCAHEKSVDILKAQYFCDKVRKKLRNLEIPNDIF